MIDGLNDLEDPKDDTIACTDEREAATTDVSTKVEQLDECEDECGNELEEKISATTDEVNTGTTTEQIDEHEGEDEDGNDTDESPKDDEIACTDERKAASTDVDEH